MHILYLISYILYLILLSAFCVPCFRYCQIRLHQNLSLHKRIQVVGVDSRPSRWVGLGERHFHKHKVCTWCELFLHTRNTCAQFWSFTQVPLSCLNSWSRSNDIVNSPYAGEQGKREGWVAASRLVTSGIIAYHHSLKIKSMLREKEANEIAASVEVSQHQIIGELTTSQMFRQLTALYLILPTRPLQKLMQRTRVPSQ